MVRFFVETQELSHPVLTGENAQHAKVLRLKAGEQVLVCDGEGQECLCSIVELRNGEVELEVLERRESQSEARVKVSVYMAFPKADKLEHVIQKATELGACEIVAFPSARCVSRPDEKSLKKKLDRWQKIAASAAEQSGRGRIPQVICLNSWQEALQRAAKADKALMFYGAGPDPESCLRNRGLCNRQPSHRPGGRSGGKRGSAGPGGRDAGLHSGKADSPL